MVDPSDDRPLSTKNGDSRSGNAAEDQRRDRPIIPSGSGGGGRTPSPPLPPPEAHPPMAQSPMAQARHSGVRSTKKKEKMGKEAAVGMKVVMVEEQGKKKKSASLENLPGRARTCGICQREFATARALFGHMRCHPDRRWRGAHPPPVSPRREEEVERERQDAERASQAEDLASSLLNIGQTILRTGKFKATEGGQAGKSGGNSGGSSTAAVVTGQGVGVKMGSMKRKESAGEASGVECSLPSSSSSGDTAREGKKKKKTAKAHDYTDDDRRKQIHSQLDLNKEAPADNEDEDDDKDKTRDATSN